MSAAPGTKKLDDQEAFERLSQILLSSDRLEVEELRQQLKEVKEQLQDEEKFAAIVMPVFDERIEELKKVFPEMFGPLITKAINVQIKESQDEVVNALYPIMGKLIKKFLRSELEQLKETIDTNVERILSPKNIWRLIKARFTGVSAADLVLADVLNAHLDNILIIQKESGKLIAEYPKGNPDDNLDMVAGMLSVIKSFMEDAFKKDQEVELIEYEDSNLLIHSATNFFVVLVLGGELEKKEKLYLLTKVNKFTEQNFGILSANNADENYGTNSELLKEFTHSLKDIGKTKTSSSNG